jgi:hypothetical protein
LQVNADFDQCMIDQAGAFGFAIDQVGSLFGAQLNAQQAFTNDASNFIEGGAVNFFGGLFLAQSSRVGFGGSTVPFGELAGAQIGNTLGGSVLSTAGQVVGRGSSYATGISGAFVGGYLAGSAAKCWAQASSGS